MQIAWQATGDRSSNNRQSAIYNLQLTMEPWPTLVRLALALGIGLFVGIERERRRKEAGLRTFAFAALLGGVGGLLGDSYALVALGLVGVLVVLLNLDTIRTGEGAEITTSAALFLTAFAGVLAGRGHTFTPTAVGVATAALLAWKEPLAGFSRALTEAEFRSAVLFAIVVFVVYPVLPDGTVDPWRLVDPRAAWGPGALIAGLGFANYILLKLYGARGIALTGFLGGLVNSTVTVTELSERVRASKGRFSDVAFAGVVLATSAMLARNAAILALLAPSVLLESAIPLGLMLAGTAAAALVQSRRTTRPRAAAEGELTPSPDPLPALESPFSLTAALKLGIVFLALQVAGTIAQRWMGPMGFYAVSLVGGIVSSASAVAAAANLAAAGALSPQVAGIAAVIASGASTIVDLPILARLGQDRTLTRRVAVVLAAAMALGAVGVLLRAALAWA
jgi:uncharacterized membrane protein (DUF4010 family)